MLAFVTCTKLWRESSLLSLGKWNLCFLHSLTICTLKFASPHILINVYFCTISKLLLSVLIMIVRLAWYKIWVSQRYLSVSLNNWNSYWHFRYFWWACKLFVRRCNVGYLVPRLFATTGDASRAELGSGEGEGVKMSAELLNVSK